MHRTSLGPCMRSPIMWSTEPGALGHKWARSALHRSDLGVESGPDGQPGRVPGGAHARRGSGGLGGSGVAGTHGDAWPIIGGADRVRVRVRRNYRHRRVPILAGPSTALRRWQAKVAGWLPRTFDAAGDHRALRDVAPGAPHADANRGALAGRAVRRVGAGRAVWNPRIGRAATAA